MTRICLLIFCTLIYRPIFSQYHPKLIPFLDTDRWGYSDTAGNLKIKASFEEAAFFIYLKSDTKSEPAARVKINGGVAIIDTAGNFIVPPGFREVKDIFYDGHLFFMVTARDGKKGIYKDRNPLIPADYDEISWSRSSPESNETIITAKKQTDSKTITLSTEKSDSIHKALPVATVSKKENVKSKRFFDQSDMLNIRKMHALDSIRFLEDGLAYIEKRGRQGIFLFDSVYYFKKKHNYISIELISKFYSGCKRKGSRVLIVEQLGETGDSYALIDENEKPFFKKKFTDIEGNYDYVVVKDGPKIGFFLKNTCYSTIPTVYDKYIDPILLPVSDESDFLIFRVLLKGREVYLGQNGVEYFRGLR